MPLPARTPLVSRAAAALMAVLMLGACSDEPAGNGGGGDIGPTIKVTITSPARDAWLLGLVELKGTVEGVADATTKARVGIVDSCKLADLHPLNAIGAAKDPALRVLAERYGVQLPDKPTTEERDKAVKALKERFDQMELKKFCQATGPTFTIRIDSRQLDPNGKPVLKDGPAVIIVSASKGDDSGSASLIAKVDNTPPKLEVIAPGPGQAFIGKVKLRVRITEKNAIQQVVRLKDPYVTDQAGKAVELEVIKPCDSKKKKGEANSCFDCKAKHKNPGGHYTAFQPKCVDKPGTYELTYDRGVLPTAKIHILMQSQDISRHTNGAPPIQKIQPVSMLKPPTFDVAASRDDPKVTSLTDYLVYDYDEDGCLDLVLCGADGVFVRPARHLPAPQQDKCSGEWLPAVQIAGGACESVHLGDLDPPDAKQDPKPTAVQDIVALTIIDGGSALQVFLARKDASPKLVQTVPLKGKVAALVVGQIDADGPVDVVVGAEEDKYAIATLVTDPEARCPTSENKARLCREATDAKTLKGGVVLMPPKTMGTLGKVKALQLGDFMYDQKATPDLVIGRDEPLISVCRNMGGGVFKECVDTGSSGPMAGMSSTDLLVAYNWTASIDNDAIDDIIVGSRKSGVVRWLAGKGDGTFEFKGGSIIMTTGACSGMTLAPLGPNGELQVLLLGGDREVVFMSLTGKEGGPTCFPSLILGGAIKKAIVADVDADGVPDLTGMDTLKPVGITVARGKGDQRFHAAQVLRVCSRNAMTGVYGNEEVGQFQVGDVTNDGRPDLLIASESASSGIDFCGEDKSPQPAFVFHLYRNANGEFESVPRSMEFAPYSKAHRAFSGAKTAGCGLTLGKLTGLELATLDNDGGQDLVFAFSNSYSHGKTPEIATGYMAFDPAKAQVTDPLAKGLGGMKENNGCECMEHNEISNNFGEDARPEKSIFCANLITDEKLTGGAEFKIASGYGGGAPIGRASLIYVKNNDQNAPFGMGSTNNGTNPLQMEPIFAQSGGKEIVAMTRLDYDGDGLDDIATLMAGSGTASDFCHLKPRVRLFRTDPSTGRSSPVLYTVQGSWTDYFIGSHLKGAALKPTTVYLGLDELSRWYPVDPENEKRVQATPIHVSYRIVPPGPLDMLAAGYCASSDMSLFTLSADNHDFCALRHAYSPTNAPHHLEAKCTTAGIDPQAFAVTNAVEEPDDAVTGCNDVIFARKKSLGFLKGGKEGFDESTFLDTDESARAGVDVFDVNDDKFDDILVLSSAKDNVEVYLGDGTGKFVRYDRLIRAPAGSSKMRTADLNGDKCKDLFVQGKVGVAVYLATHCAPK